MTAPNAASNAPRAVPARRGFPDLPCPRCGSSESFHVRLADGDAACHECDADDITAAELRKIASVAVQGQG